jgi:hypothetical protein
MKSYVVFIDRPPKADGKQSYSAMEIDHTQTIEDVERLIAAHVNEKRLNPLPAGLIPFAIYSTNTPQEAANAARDDGLVYLSIDEMKRLKADQVNAQKFGSAARPDAPISQQDIDDVYGTAFDDLLAAFGGRPKSPHP